MGMELKYARDYSVGYSKGKLRSLRFEMDYLPNLSKNRYKTRDGFIKRDVGVWMDCLAFLIGSVIKSQSLEVKPPIKLKIDGVFVGKGRMPDVQNFVDVVSDSVERGLGINDNQYKIENGLAQRGDEAKIIVEIRSEG